MEKRSTREHLDIDVRPLPKDKPTRFRKFSRVQIVFLIVAGTFVCAVLLRLRYQCGAIFGLRICLGPVNPWDSYRLGDLVNGYLVMQNNMENGKARVIEMLHETVGKGTLGERYLLRTDEGQNFDELCAIINEKGSEVNPTVDEKVELPPKGSAVVHLRLGDVMDDYGDVWNRGKDFKYWMYVKRADYWEEVVKEFQPGMPVILVGGTGHRSEDVNFLQPRFWRFWAPHQGSDLYVAHVKEFFESRGHPVTARIDNFNPDQDIMFMSHASTLAPTGGGFSRIAVECVIRNGGTVPLIDELRQQYIREDTVALPKHLAGVCQVC